MKLTAKVSFFSFICILFYFVFPLRADSILVENPNEKTLAQHMKVMRLKNEINQSDYQSLVRFIHVNQIKLVELMSLKIKIEKEMISDQRTSVNRDKLVLFLRDYISVSKELSRVQMESKLHCRVALTDKPWIEAHTEQQREPTVYGACWTNVSNDPIVRAGYDLMTLKKNVDTTEIQKDSIFIRR